MSITSREFQGLSRGKMRGKMKSSKPTIKASKTKAIKRQLNLPEDYPARRAGLGGAGI